MVTNNKTEKFLIRKSLILILLLIILSQIIFKINLAILTGLIIGYLVSFLRLRVLTALAQGMISSIEKNNKGSALNYIGVQIITATVLIIAAKISIVFFFSVALGVLTVPITIMINSFTESLGTTRNNFE